MRRERGIIYAVVFVIAIHVLVMTKMNEISTTRESYSVDGIGLLGNVHDKLKKPKQSNNKVKTIVWYDIYNHGHGLRNKAKKVDFGLCEYKQCKRLPDYIVKSDGKGAKENEAIEADAILFQGTHIQYIQIPRRQNTEQVFVFAERESWMFYGVDMGFQRYKYENKFNWTMTYRMDSDIPMPYGAIRKYPNQKLSLNSKMTQTRKEIDGKDYKRIFNDKKRDVVWFVSNCATKSLREDYVSELQKYIAVDIIGECGNHTCSKLKRANCSTNFEKNYKFILSFENTFHKDYVTEKLFDWFNRDIVQVVYGLANYSAIVPNGGVINTAEFKSPKALAEYLIAVGKDSGRYINYLKKKDGFVALGNDEMQQKAYCKLCRMLHTKNKHRRMYRHIGVWWQLNNTRGINPFVAKRVVKIGKLCKKTHNSTDKFVTELKRQKII